MAFPPKLRPRRSDLAFVLTKFATIALVAVQLLYTGRSIWQFSGSGDLMDMATFSLYTTRLFDLVAFVPTFLACYLRPATLRRWSLAIGLLCGLDFSLTVAILIRIHTFFDETRAAAMKVLASVDVAITCVMMVIQAIYLGKPWFSYGPADYDEPVVRPETLHAESEGDSAPLVRMAQESRVRSSTCALPFLAQIGPQHTRPFLFSI